MQNQNDKHIDKSKFYTVVLSSALGTNTGTISYTNYTIDWATVLPDQPYEVTFSFMSQDMSAIDMTSICMLYADFGGNNTAYKNTSTLETQNTTFLGMCYAKQFVTPTYLTGAYIYADMFSNQPVYIGSRPSANNFSIQLRKNATTLQYFNPTGFSMQPYVLVLRFKPL